jgi:hypothetical protein
MICLLEKNWFSSAVTLVSSSFCCGDGGVVNVGCGSGEVVDVGGGGWAVGRPVVGVTGGTVETGVPASSS